MLDIIFLKQVAMMFCDAAVWKHTNNQVSECWEKNDWRCGSGKARNGTEEKDCGFSLHVSHLLSGVIMNFLKKKAELAGSSKHYEYILERDNSTGPCASSNLSQQPSIF